MLISIMPTITSAEYVVSKQCSERFVRMIIIFPALYTYINACIVQRVKS